LLLRPSRYPIGLRASQRREGRCRPQGRRVARLGALIAATDDAEERSWLFGLRADAELRYQILVERRQR